MITTIFIKEILKPIYEATDEEIRIKDKVPYKLGWTGQKEILDMLNVSATLQYKRP